MGLFKRLKILEQKVEALVREQGIRFEEQPKYKVIKDDKNEMGFTARKDKD